MTRYFLAIFGRYQKIGLSARVLDGLRQENINVEDMDNTIFADAKAACCSMLLDHAPSSKLVETIRANENVMNVMLSRC
jgi:D-3-phosphoglycerate dehydrogenase / 2-oxoglutarate reductase